MSSHIDACLETDGYKMCFCSHDYCNEPTSEYTKTVKSHLEKPSDNEVLSDLDYETSSSKERAYTKDLSKNNNDDFPYVFNAETDVIIPVGSDEDESEEESSVSEQYEEYPQVGTLRDAGSRGSKESSAVKTFLSFYVYLSLNCFLFVVFWMRM